MSTKSGQDHAIQNASLDFQISSRNKNANIFQSRTNHASYLDPEIMKAEMAVNMQLPDATLDFSNATYQLSEVNRQSMVQRWNATKGRAWSDVREQRSRGYQDPSIVTTPNLQMRVANSLFDNIENGVINGVTSFARTMMPQVLQPVVGGVEAVSTFKTATPTERALMIGGAATFIAPEVTLPLLGSMGSASLFGPIAEIMAIDSFMPAAAMQMVGGGGMIASGAFSRIGLFSEGVKNARLISSINRVSSDVANEKFISIEAIQAGWQPPYPSGLDIREIEFSRETRFARVFKGDDPTGRFLVRYKEISHIIDNPEAIQVYLGLKNMPTNIADVYVPESSKLLVGRIGEQPNFGLTTRSGFQYQLLDQIPRSSFRNIRPLKKLENDYSLKFSL